MLPVYVILLDNSSFHYFLFQLCVCVVVSNYSSSAVFHKLTASSYITQNSLKFRPNRDDRDKSAERSSKASCCMPHEMQRRTCLNRDNTFRSFIANLWCSTQCHDVTTMQNKCALHGCIACMYSWASRTFTAEAENSPLCDGSIEYCKPTLDLQVALSASSK